MQNRKENVQMIVTINRRGQPVYKDGAPALIGASLRRLRNVLKGQVLHCDEEAYSPCMGFHAAPHMLDMNGSHIDDITKIYREDNWDYIHGRTDHEIEHWMVDYHGSIQCLYGAESMMIKRAFVSRLHIAQYFDVAPDSDCIVGRGDFSEAALLNAGFRLESSEYQELNIRAGGPTCAKLRHTVWRHESARKATPLFLVDNTAWAVAPAERDISRRGVELNVVPAPEPQRVRSSDELDGITGYRRPNWA